MVQVRLHFVLFSTQLMYLSLVGRNGRTSAQRLCLHRSEFPVAADNLSRLTFSLVRRFPNLVPSGVRVPQWALIDVTVRC
jgi:hypothetical protein